MSRARCSALDRDRMAPGAQADYVIVVPTRTLDDILDEAEAPAPIDLLSVDVEGHELEVLRGFDFARWQPRLILLEDHVGNLQTHRFLQGSGYRLIRRARQQRLVCAGATPGSTSAGDRWEILRKYYLALPFRVAAQRLAPGPTRARWLTADAESVSGRVSFSLGGGSQSCASS